MPDPNQSPEKPMVYVVDDETEVGTIVTAILELEGFDTRFFSKPAIALEAFASAPRKPDVLVTDFVMTPMNGMELIHECKALAPGLPTVLYSGNVNSDITESYTTKPDAFIAKPFLPSELVQLVSSIVRNRDTL